MMDTVLNLGLNDDSVEAMAEAAGERFAFDAYRRLINMFGDVVMDVDHHHFEEAFEGLKKKLKVKEDTDVDAAGLRRSVICTRRSTESMSARLSRRTPWVA